MTDTDKYRRFCEQSPPTLPLYAQAWWLDAVCGPTRWDAIVSESPAGHIRAAMPLYRPARGIVIMPPFTQTMGPWFDTDDFAERQALSERFACALKDTACFAQNFSPDITDWLPFYWHGFRQTTRYTYLISPLDDADRLLADISKPKRRHIRQAQQEGITVRRDVPIDRFLLLYTHIFARQGLPPYQPRILERLIHAALARNQGCLWGAYDAEDNLHAALFIATTGDLVSTPLSVKPPLGGTAYCIAGGSEPAYRHTNANCLLLREILQHLCGRFHCFDFEGSMMRGVESFNREFGARQTPYFAVAKGRLTLFRRVRIKINRYRRP